MKTSRLGLYQACILSPLGYGRPMFSVTWTPMEEAGLCFIDVRMALNPLHSPPSDIEPLEEATH